MKRVLRMLVLCVTAAALVGVARAAEKKFEKKFQVSPGGTLTLGTDVGTVKIIGGSSNEVSVVTEIRGREKDVNKFDVSAEQNGNNVEIKGKLHKSSSWFWNSTDLEVEYAITVPRQFSVNTRTAGGDISVQDLKGTINGETSGGDISIGGTEGEVELETSGGNVSAEKCVGKIHMETSGGDIRVSSATGDVDVSTSGGNVKISDVEGKVRAETSGGNVTVKVKGSNKGIYAETSGGNIDILVPKGVGANIDAGTSGGEVHCDMPVTMTGKIDESRVKGTVNGGGSTIYAHTSGGEVRIRASE